MSCVLCSYHWHWLSKRVGYFLWGRWIIYWVIYWRCICRGIRDRWGVCCSLLWFICAWWGSFLVISLSVLGVSTGILCIRSKCGCYAIFVAFIKYYIYFILGRLNYWFLSSYSTIHTSNMTSSSFNPIIHMIEAVSPM